MPASILKQPPGLIIAILLGSIRSSSFLVFITILTFYSCQISAAPEQVSIQLQGQHSFQFAESSQIKNHFFYSRPDQDTVSVKLTAQEQAWIKVHPQVSVGGGPDWAPFDFVDNHGHYSGIANDYLNLLAKNTGLKFKITIDQWSNQLQKIRNQQIDLLGAAYYTAARTQYVSYSTAYFEVLDYFFIRDDLNVKTLQDLNGKRVAIPKDYAHGEILKKHFPKIDIVTVDNFGAAIDAVLENRADMLYDNYAALTYTFKKEGINTIIPFKSTRELGNNAIHFITRKDAPELTAIIQKGLDAISNQEKQAIYNKWLGNTLNAKKQKLKLTTDEQQWLRNHPDIRLGVDSNWPPYEFIDQSGQLQGISADVLSLLEQRLGIQFQVVSHYSWAEMLEKAKNQDIDMLSSITQTPNRDHYLNFTDPFFTPLIAIYTRKDNTEISSLDDLKNKTVVIENQYFLHERLTEGYPEIKLLPVETTLDALKALSYGNAEAYVGNQGAANWIAEQNAINNLKLRPETALGKSPLRMAVRKDWHIFQSILNKALADISSAELSAVRRKWVGNDSSTLKLSLSATEQQWLNQHKIIRFTGDPNWLPYEAFDKQGNYIGIVAEHLKLIEQKLGIKVEIIPTRTWSESVAKIKRGEIDVLSETIDSDLKSQLSFTQDYISSPVVIVMRNDEDYVEDITQIKQRKIAVIKEYGYVPKIIKKLPDISFHSVDTIQDGLTAVSTGQVDALLATLAQASYHISELGINNIRIVGKTKFNTRLAFGMRQEFAPLVPLFNRALASINKGEQQRILDSWGKQKFAAKIDYASLAKIAGVFLLIIAVIIYWNRKLAKEIARRKEIEAQTQALIDKIPLQIIVTSFNGQILSANPQALSDHNINKEEFADFNILDFYNDTNDRDIIVKEIAENGKVEQKILTFKKRDGTLRSMMISIMPVTYLNQNALLTIAVDMTERLEMEDALYKAKETAETANQAKSAFLANMSHEIRTPMNAIIGFTELLDEQLKDPKLKSFVKTIRSAGNNLLALINDILDLSKIEAGKLRIQKKPCNPHDLFTELGDIFMMKMREKDLDFIMDIDPVIPQSLLLDATRLRQVLFNLIGNAVKFTDSGSISINARTDNEDEIHSKLDLLINVEDSGIGISEDQQQLIFQAFEQTSGQDVSQYGGTGLGLSISKRLVEMMGGQISLSSQPDVGSTFTVKLTDVDIATLTGTAENIITVHNTGIIFHPGVILIVDDVADNRSLLLECFADTPLQTVEAENGLEAVNLAKQQQFDLVLMDIRMPVMNGYQAALEIKKFSRVPILALTASVMTDEFDRVKGEQFDAYLRKPVLKADLIKELSRFLPYQENPAVPESDVICLTKEELEWLPPALAELEKLIPHYETVAKNNNISDIQKFADAAMNTAKKYPISAVMEYATQLKNHLDCFDIAAIRREINRYPQLISELEHIADKRINVKHLAT